MTSLDLVWDAIDSLHYDDLCIVMAYLLTKGIQDSETFAKDVQAELDMIAIIAGIREQLEARTCAH